MVFGAIPQGRVLDRIQTVESSVDQVGGDVELGGDDPRVQGPGESLTQPAYRDEGSRRLGVDGEFLARDQPAWARSTLRMDGLMGQCAAQLWPRQPPVDGDTPVRPPAAATA